MNCNVCILCLCTVSVFVSFVAIVVLCLFDTLRVTLANSLSLNDKSNHGVPNPES